MRVLGPVLLVAAIIGIVVAENFSSGQTSAQDTSDERITNLETLVNELAAQVADLTARVEALEGTSGGAASDAGEASAGSAGDVSLSGTGDTATDLIELQGVYTLDASCADGFVFTIDGVNVDNPDEFVIIPLVGQPPFEGSTVMTFEGGRYAFSISCTGAWTLDLTVLG
jgi:hypothetical protein